MPVRPGAPRARMAAQRRKMIVTVLSGSTFTFLLLSFIQGGLFVPLCIVSAVLTVGYVGLMVYLLGAHAEREMKVAFLPHRGRVAPQSRPVQLREASSGRR